MKRNRGHDVDGLTGSGTRLTRNDLRLLWLTDRYSGWFVQDLLWYAIHGRNGTRLRRA